MIDIPHFAGFWSKFVFWFGLANIVMTLGFTVAVIIGGIFDLKYLFTALREERVDVQDDGRVITPPAQESQPPRRGFPAIDDDADEPTS